MRMIEKVNRGDLRRFFRSKSDFWLVMFLMSIFCVFPVYSASNEISGIENGQLESNMWLLTDIQSQEVNIYFQEEPIVIDKNHLQTKLRFSLNSDSVKKWNLKIFDPRTLEILFTLNGTSEELGEPIECNLYGNQRNQYYCMFTLSSPNENSLKSRPFIFYMRRKGDGLTTDLSSKVNSTEQRLDNGINEWVFFDVSNDEINLYIEQVPHVIDRNDLQRTLQLYFHADQQKLIKEWKMRLYDSETLEPVLTFNGTAKDLGEPIEWILNDKLADEYYCMFTVFYETHVPIESKPYIFFIRRQEDKDYGESNSMESDENSGGVAPIDLEEAQEEYIVEKPGKIQIEQFFMVGFADLTLGKIDIQRHVEAVSGLDDYEEGIYLDGHLALYLKGKIQGKYLLTAQIDTDEKPVEEMFVNLTRKESSYILQNIEPDVYYPVYGDDSVSSIEIDTSGKLYLKIEWDQSEILWGNYRIGLNETEIMNFNRQLYGAKAHFESPAMVDADNSQTKADFFWAEALTLHSKDEIKTTGGLLYYLKHTDMINYSEQLTVEVRDTISGRVIRSYPLKAGRDYKIDWLNGIIILTQRIESNVDLEELITNKETYLIAEYEYDPQSDLDNSTYGCRTSHYFTDTLKLGGSFFKEKVADGKSYQLYGFDASYKLHGNTYLTAEWANSGKIFSGNFYSEDGGLTYIELPELDEKKNGRAVALGLKTNLPQLSVGISNFNLSLNYKFYEKGFSTSKVQALNDISQYDLKVSTDFVSGYLKDYTLVSKYNYKKDGQSTATSSVCLMNDQSDSLKITRELKYQSTQEPNQKESSNLVAAVRFEYKPDEFTTIYSNPQLTLMSNGESEKDNRVTLGFDRVVDNKTHFNYEVSGGDFGCRINLGGGHDFTSNNNIYANVLFVLEQQKNEKTLLTLGHRGKLTDLLDMYVEHQLGYGDLEDSITDILGLDYTPTANWAFFVDYTKKKIERLANQSTEIISRNLLSNGVTYHSEEIDYSTRLQMKQDRGAENIEEYLLTNSLEWEMNYMISLLVGFDYSLTKTDLKEEDNKKSVRGDLGLAFRPTDEDRLNLFGKYTYLYNSPLEEVDLFPAEQAHIISFEGLYDLTEKWQIGEKLAYKNVKTNSDDHSDTWEESKTYLWVNRLNYHLINQWDINGEYRVLLNPLANDKKSGFLVAFYYRINPDFKIGAGYNFTDFSDDLTDLNYQEKGPFVNLIVLW